MLIIRKEEEGEGRRRRKKGDEEGKEVRGTETTAEYFIWMKYNPRAITT